MLSCVPTHLDFWCLAIIGHERSCYMHVSRFVAKSGSLATQARGLFSNLSYLDAILIRDTLQTSHIASTLQSLQLC